MTLSFHMSLDSALNLVWVLVGLGALGVLGFSERFRAATTLRSRCRLVIAVVIATVSLFPTISSNDDSVCLAQLHISPARHAGWVTLPTNRSSQRPDFYLAVQLKSLANFQISSSNFSLTFYFQFPQFIRSAVLGYERPLPSHSDRAPPQIPS
jgi:hypothetical protein